MQRSVQWRTNELQLLNQRRLPLAEEVVTCRSEEDVIGHIQRMTVRGAPAIGAAGAYGFVLFFLTGGSSADVTEQQARQLKQRLDAARPTAVNLSHATAFMLQHFLRLHHTQPHDLSEQLLQAAHAYAQQDVEVNRKLSVFGAEIIPQNANILHHCNTGKLATVDIGTALGVIYEAHSQKKNIHVWVDETRPRLQGARLSAWELMKEGVPMHLICDNAAGLLMYQKKVDVVLFGADRVAANGDVVNKIGTYKLAVVAKENNIPVFACVPTSTIDMTFEDASSIPIEERDEKEVSCISFNDEPGLQIAPANCPVYNPAFDITPGQYLTGIITEFGICYPPFKQSLEKIMKEANEFYSKEI